LQQIQIELRHLQQTLIIKQDELTQLNRDNERLLTEARQQQKGYLDLETVRERQAGEINSLKTLIAQGEGGKQVLLDQVSSLQHNIDELAEALEKRSLEANELVGELDAVRNSVAKGVDGGA
jgi:chromosome segregation ATPase